MTERFPDKYHLTPDLNRRFIVKNFTELVYNNSRFEGLTTTLPQTQTIIDGLGVDGVPVDDINTIVQLKRGWQYMMRYQGKIDQNFEKQINKIVARDDALVPGEVRTQEVQVGDYTPAPLDVQKEKEFLQELLTSDRSTTDKAMTLMYHNMRNQLFWDGNKRSASIIANRVMMMGGAGIIMVPLSLWGTWNKLIHDYYLSGNLEKLKKWTYDNGIIGINLN